MTWPAILFACLGAVLWLGAWRNYRAAQAIHQDADRLREDIAEALKLLEVRRQFQRDLAARPGARSTWEGPEVTR